MNGFLLQHPQWLAGLLVLPLLVLAALYAGWRGARARRRFFDQAADRPFARAGSVARSILRTLIGTASITCALVALARPSSDPKPRTVERAGRDVVFAIDVSRSMLAQDLAPSRLARAKLAVCDVLDVAQGDRIAIVAFAGTAVVKCPLTTDYSFARMAVDDLSPNSVSRGGTAIGEALRAATALLFPARSTVASTDRARTIFLITDGEDHESQPVEAAKAAGERGVRIVTLGFGSELAGAPVPAGDDRPGRFIQYQGAGVTSHLDSGTLKDIASATPGGVFLNVGTGNIELDTVYTQLMQTSNGTVTTTNQSVQYTEWFQLFLLVALALLAVEGLTYVRA